MNLREVRGGGQFSAFAVLLAASVVCALILWGGGQLSGRAISALFGNAPSSAAMDETIASIMIFGLIFGAGVVGGAVSGFNAARLGPRAGLRMFEGGAIGLVGFLIATALAGIAGVLHRAHGGSGAGLFLWGTALILFQAGSEEVFFRGWMQPVLVQSWGAPGVVVTAIAFALLHLIGGAAAAVSVLNLFLGGLLFGVLAARFNGIAAAFAAHFSWNWAEQLVLGLDPNPGNGSFGSILNFDLVGSTWWGGSGEGLNASIAMTFALAIILVPLLIFAARAGPPLGQRRPERVAA
jgi:uncharacterized protein